MLVDPTGTVASTADQDEGGACNGACVSSIHKVNTGRSNIDWLQRIMVGDDATATRIDGVLVVNNVGALSVEGILTRALNRGDGSVTWSSNYVTSSVSLERMRNSGNLDHEFGHVAQARELGMAYMPAYVAGFGVQPVIWAESGFSVLGQSVSYHDAHPMERDAEIRAGHGDPWGFR